MQSIAPRQTVNFFLASEISLLSFNSQSEIDESYIDYIRVILNNIHSLFMLMLSFSHHLFDQFGVL